MTVTYLLMMFLFFRDGSIHDIRHLATFTDQETCIEELHEAEKMDVPKNTWFACVPSTVVRPTNI